MYYSHYQIIKYVGFESIHYTFNLGVVSSSKVFSGFDFMFLSNVSIKFFLFKKKIIDF